MQVVVDMELAGDGRARSRRTAGGSTSRCGAAATPLRSTRRCGPTRVGKVDGDGEAMVRVDAVRRLAAGSVGATWDDDFAAMLDYARSKGWLSDDGASIRAHVEWG